MKWLPIYGLLLLIFLTVSAGCVGTPVPAEENKTVDDAGNVMFGDEANGRMLYVDGTVDTWTSDASGNITHTLVEPNGVKTMYVMMPDGTIEIQM